MAIVASTDLAPVESSLAALRDRRGPDATRGLVPGLLVAGAGPAWLPASALVSGERLDELLDTAKQRWGAAPAAAAALAWRSYTYWLVAPVVHGWVTARLVPAVEPDNVLLRMAADHARPLLTVGLRRPRRVVLDPTRSLQPAHDVSFVTSEQELLDRLRFTVREAHLDPLLAQIQRRVRLGTRTLLGSLASAVAYGVTRGLATSPGAQAAAATTLLTALDVADLVTLTRGPGGLVVERRTCCLAFTLPEPKLCSGCCVPPAALR